MNILFLGQFYPPRLLETFMEDTGNKVGFSNHNFEKSLLKGFAARKDVCLKAITAPLAFSYPHNNRRAYIRAEKFSEYGAEVSSVSFCNIVGINTFDKIRSMASEIKRVLPTFPSGKIYIVVNNPAYVPLAALFKALKKNKREVVTTLVVPDVAECITGMDHFNPVRTWILKSIDRKIAAYSGRFDRYVYLTAQMNDFFKKPEKDFIVVEGLIDEDRVDMSENTPADSSGKEIILYTGTLRRIFGVMELVKMFEKGRFPSCELWICGGGECADEIRKAAEKNHDIKFFGLVSLEEALRLQSQATILANPRSASGEYTRYSFPSKTIEYLLAGKTVIMNRLPGIPAEYDRFLSYPDSETADAWIEKLNEIFKMNRELRSRNERLARDFIIAHKSAKAQCARIIGLMTE